MLTAQVEDKNIVIKEFPAPKLGGRKGAIVKVLGCGLCGSDIVKFRQGLVKNGTVLGHEIVAVIDEIDSDTNFQVGDRIVTSHHVPCFNCTYCIHGNYSMCDNFKNTNIFPGGFSEKVFLSEEHLKHVAFKVPVGISNEEISFYEPLACCIRAINRCNLKPTDIVLVVGLGSIGLLMSKALKAKGYKVYACDLIEDRINQACLSQIDSFNSENLDILDLMIRSKTQNFGVDAVFMTSGADKALDVALKTIKLGGKILVFSSTPNNSGYYNNEIYYKELTVLGSYSPSPKDLEDAFNMIVNKKIDVKNLTTKYSLNDIQKAFDDTISNRVFKAYINVSEPEDIEQKFVLTPKQMSVFMEHNILDNGITNTNINDKELIIDNCKLFTVRNSKFCIPVNTSDCIHQIILGTKNYWDSCAHDIIDKYLDDNATILDIGANVGSHTLYWANERKAKMVHAFEPLPYSFEILKKHIELNNLKKKVKIYPYGLSDEVTRTKISKYHEMNIGGTSFKKQKDGDFEFRSLDSLKLKEKIDLIKIDVEGAEMEVLQGGIDTIKKNKPVIVIETFDKKDRVDKFLFALGYEHVDTIREGEDYIYRHKCDSPKMLFYNEFSKEQHKPIKIDASSKNIKNNTFQIHNSKMFLPQKNKDLIQSCIYSSKDYWDTTNLSKIDKRLKPDAVILDVGANIGNHTLYWANERQAKKIFAFEPYPSSYQILKTNIKLNDLKKVVKAFDFALSDENTKAQVCGFCTENIGGTGFTKNKNGDFEFKTLDSLKLKEKIDLIKIDVEGCELDVLIGGIDTIKKNKPIIVIESFDKKEKIEEILIPIGYTLVDENSSMCDYIYQCIEETISN